MKAIYLIPALLSTAVAASTPVQVELDCIVTWDYPAEETRHIGFQIWEQDLGKIWDSSANQSLRSVSCTDIGVKAGNTYSIKIRAYNKDTASESSESVVFKVADSPLPAPTNLNVN